MGQSLKSCLKKIFLSKDAESEADAHNSPFVPQRLNGEPRVLQPAYTVRLKPDPEKVHKNPESATVTEEMTITWCGLTDTGKARVHNEDYFSCTELREGTLFVVADGMGGHDAGEVASRLAVERISKEIRGGTNGKNDPRKVLEHAVQRANDEVLREGACKGSNMGTTVTLALIIQNKAYIANVGDSRTYWIENASIKRITEDHSLVEKLVSLGRLRREEARKHPQSNVLYRNIGSEPPVKVDTFQVPLKKGGNLLLCTDGLWGEVSDEDIHKIFITENDARTTCTSLIRTANESGGKDNITAVVVKVL